MRHLAALAAALALAGCASSAAMQRAIPAAPSRLDARVDSLLARMTLEEKAGQLTIAGGRPDLRELARTGRIGGTNGVLPGVDVARYTREMQELALQSRLGIPLLFMGDVIHGFRTVLPVPLAQAATWDPELVRRADSVAAAEATAAGVTWTFAPMLDIARDPRWGRVVESPGEDPYLGAVMARAAVRGYQGDSLAASHTMLETWLPGTEAGHAVADVLFGDANPGGKLPVTFPRNVGQIPIYYAHLSTGRPPNPDDRYTSKYLDIPNTPLFPFGYGLSYTTFELSKLRLSRTTISPGDTLEASVSVTNTGARAGSEVVQLYLRDEVASIARPVQELKRFTKVYLQPAQTRNVSFRLSLRDLAFLGREMRCVAEPGAFTVRVGSNSRDAREARFELLTDGREQLPVEDGCRPLS